MELTTHPFSITTVLTPRFCSSMAQARPVGPAPTTRASKGSVIRASQLARDLGVDGFESAIERRRIFASAFGHVGTAAAFAADSLRDGADKFTGVDLGDEVLGHRG